MSFLASNVAWSFEAIGTRPLSHVILVTSLLPHHMQGLPTVCHYLGSCFIDMVVRIELYFILPGVFG